MALMDITYSNCINTFDNESMTLIEMTDRIEEISTPVQIPIPTPKEKRRDAVIDHFREFFNEKFGNGVVLGFPIENYFTILKWEVKRNDIFLILSDEVARMFKLESEVISPDDHGPQNIDPLDDIFDIDSKKPLFVIAVPMNYSATKFVIKRADEVIDDKTVWDRFWARVNTNYVAATKATGFHINAFKTFPDRGNVAFLLSPPFQRALGFRQRGKISSYRGRLLSFLGSNLKRHMKDEWSITLHKVENIAASMAKLIRRTIQLEPCRLSSSNEVVEFLTKKILRKGISFRHEQDIARLIIEKENVTVQMSDTVRDILAFDSNIFRGKGEYVASDKLSLTRRIRFFYIYTNIGDMVRIGNTEAPLLAVLPFHPNPCHMFTEKSFQTPMYVPVTSKNISQIDIGIYDDAGCRIPFTDKMSTSLKIHFRQV